MATIDNLRGAADVLLAKAVADDAVESTDTDDVFAFPVNEAGDVFALGSESTDVVAGDSGIAVLYGDADANLVGGDGDDFLVGNDGDNVIVAAGGNDQVSTGDGDDVVALGTGNDYITVDGTGTKILDGGKGDDTFVIKASGEDSHTTLTGLNSGDKLRLYADANDDGQIDMRDVDVDKTVEEDGNTTLVLVDGTTVVLEGVTGFFENAKFETGTDDDGELFVDIS
ncbi:MAG: hypothetical protein KAJ63_02150 [Methyloprofundus sp.]|nr:hypothetical protein [Methyloprofundus sp.]